MKATAGPAGQACRCIRRKAKLALKRAGCECWIKFARPACRLQVASQEAGNMTSWSLPNPPPHHPTQQLACDDCTAAADADWWHHPADRPRLATLAGRGGAQEARWPGHSPRAAAAPEAVRAGRQSLQGLHDFRNSTARLQVPASRTVRQAHWQCLITSAEVDHINECR